MPSAPQKPASTLLVVIAFTIVYIVWGSTYFFIKVTEQGGFPPFFLGAVRFTIAGIAMLAWCAFRGEKIFIKSNVIHASIGGLLVLFVGNGGVIWAEQTIPSAVAAILASLTPIWFVLIDKPNWSINFKDKSAVIGLVIGFLGVILLFGEQVDALFKNGAANSKLPWMALLLVSGIAWATGSLYSKKKLTNASTTVSTAWQMIAAGIAFMPCTFLHHEFDNFSLRNITYQGWGGLIYLMLFGSIAAFSAYVWLLKVRPATQVSTYAYVNPVIAVMLGVLFAKENISLLQLGGLVTVLCSVLLINLAKYRKALNN